MKKDWEVKKLSEICEFFNDGNWIESKDQSESGIRLIQTGNVGISEFKNKSGKERYISQETFEKLKCTEIFEGDILISRLPDPVGRTCLVPALDQRMITAVDCTIVRLNKDLILSKYFSYFSQSLDYFKNISERITGTTRDRISRSNLGLIPIPFPKSLKEQQEIVSILDEAFAAIDKARENVQRNLQNAKELFQSELNSIFTNKGEGWVEKKLMEVCTFINGRAYSKNELLDKGKYTVLRVGNFFTNKHWYYSDLELDEDKYCDNGDLLYAWSASFGPRIWEGEKVIYHYHIWKVVPQPHLITKEFLFKLLEWDTEKIKAKHGTGTTMIHVSKGSMESRVVYIPSIEKQQQIVQQLDILSAETKKLESIYTTKLKYLDELKKSILQKAFSGELTNTKDKYEYELEPGTSANTN